MKQILIYRDEGVCASSFRHIFSTLTQLYLQYETQAVDHRFFFTKGWERSVALIVFPGGRDLRYHLCLQGQGNATIRSYVEGGGRYLGICAGGYYGASYIEFEKGRELEVCGPRELAFFPGMAIGPAYGETNFSYSSENSARAASIAWERGVCKLYYHGGCFFQGVENYPLTQVIATYNDLPQNPAAVVYCRVKEGGAILSGVHPEYNTNEFFEYVLNKILT